MTSAWNIYTIYIVKISLSYYMVATFQDYANSKTILTSETWFEYNSNSRERVYYHKKQMQATRRAYAHQRTIKNTIQISKSEHTLFKSKVN